jgi:hypothetical protein
VARRTLAGCAIATLAANQLAGSDLDFGLRLSFFCVNIVNILFCLIFRIVYAIILQLRPDPIAITSGSIRNAAPVNTQGDK